MCILPEPGNSSCLLGNVNAVMAEIEITTLGGNVTSEVGGRVKFICAISGKIQWICQTCDRPNVINNVNQINLRFRQQYSVSNDATEMYIMNV